MIVIGYWLFCALFGADTALDSRIYKLVALVGLGLFALAVMIWASREQKIGSPDLKIANCSVIANCELRVELPATCNLQLVIFILCCARLHGHLINTSVYLSTCLPVSQSSIHRKIHAHLAIETSCDETAAALLKMGESTEQCRRHAD